MRELEDKTDPEKTKLSICPGPLTLLAPRALVPAPSTKARGVEMDHHKYLKKVKCYKPKTLGGGGGVLGGILQGLK